jgi:hypothetical protein
MFPVLCGVRDPCKMTATYAIEDLRKIILLMIEIGELRLRLCRTRTAILAHGYSGKIDPHSAELLEDAFESDRDLAAIVSSVSRRLRSPDGCAELMTRPLNKFAAAHFELAKAHADELDACAIRLGRCAAGSAGAAPGNPGD